MKGQRCSGEQWHKFEQKSLSKTNIFCIPISKVVVQCECSTSEQIRSQWKSLYFRMAYEVLAGSEWKNLDL
jgi:hypothetical protein